MVSTLRVRVTRFVLGAPLLLAVAVACGGEGGESTGPERPEATTLEVRPATVTLTPGETAELEAIPRDSTGNPVPGYTVSWASRDTSVATVDTDGTVTGQEAGTTRVTATAERDGQSVSGSAELAVEAPQDDDGGGSESDLLITSLKPEAYEIDTLRTGIAVYVDRDFTVDAVPSRYEGWTYLRTANDDKGSDGDSTLAFTLKDTGTVAVAYDERATELPDWLRDWTATNDTIGTTDVDHPIFTRNVGPGEMVLGGNMAGGAEGARSMYVVFAVGSDSIPEDGGTDTTTATGALRVATSTAGDSLDSDGYTVTLDNSTSRSVGINDTTVYADLSTSDHTVELSGVASNCSLSGSNPRTVSVAENDTISSTFDVTCETTSPSSSTAITNISFDAPTHNRFATDGDIYPTTWADDGHLYTMGGDENTGWDNEDVRGLSVVRLDEVGPDGDLSQGIQLDSKVDVLPKGIISIDGTLYRFEEERADADGDGGQFEDLMIAKSTDHGSTWSYLTGGDPTNDADYTYNGLFTNLAFVQMGQDYQTWWDTSYGGEGDYVYFAGNNGNETEVILGRAPRGSDLRDPANHEWFTGTDSENNATWSTNVADRQPVYTASGIHWGATITWNPVLNRFLLTHFDAGNNGVLTVLEGPTPWGPWSNIYESHLPDSLSDGIEKYRIQFVNKRGTTGVTDWLSSDGTAWWAVFSGMDEWDSVNVVRATLQLAQ